MLADPLNSAATLIELPYQVERIQHVCFKMERTDKAVTLRMYTHADQESIKRAATFSEMLSKTHKQKGLKVARRGATLRPFYYVLYFFLNKSTIPRHTVSTLSQNRKCSLMPKMHKSEINCFLISFGIMSRRAISG